MDPMQIYDPNSGHNYQAVVEFDIEDNGQLREAYLADLEKNWNNRVFYSLSCPRQRPAALRREALTYGSNRRSTWPA